MSESGGKGSEEMDEPNGEPTRDSSGDRADDRIVDPVGSEEAAWEVQGDNALSASSEEVDGSGGDDEGSGGETAIDDDDSGEGAVAEHDVDGSGEGTRAEDDDDGDEADDEAEAEAELVRNAPPLSVIVEGILFAAAAPVALARLQKVLGAWPKDQVVAAIDQLRESLESSERGVRLVESEAGLQLRTSPNCAPWVRRCFAEKPPRLSRPVLETLAIIAYRQPVTRGEVEAIRGVNCDAVMTALLSRGLVQVVGRRQSPGRPVEYGTTPDFLELFTLKDLGELPPLPDGAALESLLPPADAEELEALEGEVLGEAGGESEGEVVSEADVEGLGAAEAAGAQTLARSVIEDGSTEAEEEMVGDRAVAKDPQPVGDRLEASGGGADPGGSGPSQWEGDPGARDQGGSD